MLDFGWSEMAVIALLALLVIGPKDLPRVMRTVGQWMRKARGIAREFQSGIDEMIRDSELDDARKTFEQTKRLDIDKEIEESVDPGGDFKESVREIERTTRSEKVDGDTSRKKPDETSSEEKTSTAKSKAGQSGAGRSAKDGGTTKNSGASSKDGSAQASQARSANSRAAASRGGNSSTAGNAGANAKSAGNSAGKTASNKAGKSAAKAPSKSAGEGGGASGKSSTAAKSKRDGSKQRRNSDAPAQTPESGG